MGGGEITSHTNLRNDNAEYDELVKIRLLCRKPEG